MDAKLSSCLVQLTLAVFVVLILPNPASPAPLALQVHVPIDVWKPVVVHPRPTEPRPREQINTSVQKPGGGEGDDGDGDGGDKVRKLKFRGMDLPREFGAYDLDQNRGVSLAELAEVTDTKLNDAREPFEAADTDGNKVLSQEEFTQAPWLFDAGGITLIDSAVEPGVEAEGAGGAGTFP